MVGPLFEGNVLKSVHREMRVTPPFNELIYVYIYIQYAMRKLCLESPGFVIDTRIDMGERGGRKPGLISRSRDLTTLSGCHGSTHAPFS
jgi:hypothetical protein